MNQAAKSARLTALSAAGGRGVRGQPPAEGAARQWSGESARDIECLSQLQTSGSLLGHAVVYRSAVVPIAIEDVLVDGVALLRIQLTREYLGQPIKCFLDCNSHCRSRPLLLPPIQHELVPPKDS